MPIQDATINVGNKDHTMQFRLPAELKGKFIDWCNQHDVKPSIVLRWFMKETIDNKWKPNQFQKVINASKNT